MYYIIANNPNFNISKVTRRLRDGDVLVHCNNHIFFHRIFRACKGGKVCSEDGGEIIPLRCRHEIFFNTKLLGLLAFRRKAGYFSRVYYCSTSLKGGARQVPSRFRSKRVRQIIEEAGEHSEEALEIYFHREPRTGTHTVTSIPRALRAEAQQNELLIDHRHSIGHKALRCLLQYMEPDYIKLAGFTFKGWRGHPWRSERDFAREQGIEIIT